MFYVLLYVTFQGNKETSTHSSFHQEKPWDLSGERWGSKSHLVAFSEMSHYIYLWIYCKLLPALYAMRTLIDKSSMRTDEAILGKN